MRKVKYDRCIIDVWVLIYYKTLIKRDQKLIYNTVAADIQKVLD